MKWDKSLKLLFLLGVPVFLAACATQQNIVFSIKGKPMSCRDASGFMTQPDSYFQGWSDTDFYTAITVSERNCFSALSDEPKKIRARLTDIREENSRQEELIKSERIARQAKKNRCLESPEFRLYATSRATLDSLKNLNYWTDSKKKQDDYARESGVRDLSAERQIGVMIVETRKRLFESFEEYRSLGGKERDPVKLFYAPRLKDPCNGA